MVDIQSTQLDLIFRALANPTRRLLIQRLTAGPAKVGDLAQPFDMTLAAISKHLLTLEAASLITRETIGRETLCTLAGEALDVARTVLDEYRSFWERQLDALGAHLDDGS